MKKTARVPLKPQQVEPQPSTLDADAAHFGQTLAHAVLLSVGALLLVLPVGLIVKLTSWLLVIALADVPHPFTVDISWASSFAVAGLVSVVYYVNSVVNFYQRGG